MFETDAVVGGGEGDVARGIDLAGDGLTNRRLAGTRPLWLRPAGQRSGFFDWLVPLSVGGDQHSAVVDADQPVPDRYIDGFAGWPNADLVKLRREADLPVTADLASR